MHKISFISYRWCQQFPALVAVFWADRAFAQTLNNPTSTYGTLEDFILVLVTIIQWVALPVLALCLVYAGFQLVSAGGDEKKVTSGKMWLYSSLIGAAVILSARVIAVAVFGTADALK